MTESSSVARYLADIGRHALLTREQETALAERIRRGDRAALDALVTANLRLAVMFARKYTGLGLPLEDLVAEGNLGLLRAAELFNPAHGCKFSSYAAWGIKDAIFRALNEAATVRVPLQKARLLRKTRRVAGELEAQFGRRAADDEIAAAADLKPGDLARLRAASLTVTSLDAPLASAEDDGEAATLAALLPDEGDADAGAAVSQQDLAAAAVSLLDTLNERERQILSHYFGLRGARKNCREIAGELNLTHQRVYQLLYAALDKLRRRLDGMEFYL